MAPARPAPACPWSFFSSPCRYDQSRVLDSARFVQVRSHAAPCHGCCAAWARGVHACHAVCWRCSCGAWHGQSMPCGTTPCHADAQPCPAMRCNHAAPCHAMPCHTFPCRNMPCPAVLMPCAWHARPHHGHAHAASCRPMPCHAPQAELPKRLARRLMDLQLLPYIVVNNPNIKRVVRGSAGLFDSCSPVCFFASVRGVCSAWP